MLAALSFAGSDRRSWDFRFSQGAFAADEIFDSALAAPGRYLGEIGRRVAHGDWLAIANPLLPVRSALLAQWLGVVADRPMIVADSAGFPLIYVLPRRLWPDGERFLLLLSAQQAELDSRLLEHICGQPVPVRRLDLPAVGPIPSRGSNGWLNGDGRLAALTLQATRSLAMMAAEPDWRELPFAVYYPMHAGDVLFMAIASTLDDGGVFSKQVVCDAYADIPAASASRLETLRLKLPWIARDGSVSEAAYFSHALERLGPLADRHFIVFARILRLYFKTPFHLVDHARFALGASITAFAQTLHGRPPPAPRRCALPPEPLRVLFHLNGGWKLKNFPRRGIETVIKALGRLGVESSVVDRPDLTTAGARSVESPDSASLRALIERHHLYVGVDSFPHHFARLVMGWPTIGLFGNTKPTNSDAAYGAAYQTSDQLLSCNRCGAYDGCPAFGGEECANYAPPERIVGDIMAMAERIYGFRP